MPIKLIIAPHGQKKVIPDGSKIQDFFGVGFRDSAQLTDLFIKEKLVHPKQSKINYAELSLKFKLMIDSREVKNRADLARKLNVSRAWITKVMKNG